MTEHTSRRWPRLLQLVVRGVTLLGVAAIVVSPLVTRQGTAVALGLISLAFVVGLLVVTRRDGQSVLTLMLLLLFLLPENYVFVGPLKSTGNPAQMVGMLALGLWVAARILGLIDARRGHPIRWLFLVYAVTVLAGFAAAATRTLTTEEASGAVRALFPAAAALGIGLLAVDGLQSRERVETLLEHLVLFGGVAAFIGIVQFVSGFNYFAAMQLPGLTTNTEVIDDTRSGFARIDVAAAHPIEYAVVLACLAPLALHLALYASTQARRRSCGAALLLILVVNPMSVSRSGILALAVGLAVYVVHLSNRARFNAAVLAVIGVAFFRAAVPGLLGTIKSLLLIGEKDPSIAGRTEDYTKIPALIEGHVWFGRGLGTFQPSQYFYLDNQYLGSFLEGGVLGLTVLVATFVTGICVARGVRHRSGDPGLRGLGQALAGSIAALGAAAVTFDELSFRQTGFTLFLLLGCAGALWSLVHDDPRRHPSGVVRESDPRSADAVSA